MALHGPAIASIPLRSGGCFGFAIIYLRRCFSLREKELRKAASDELERRVQRLESLLLQPGAAPGPVGTAPLGLAGAHAGLMEGPATPGDVLPVARTPTIKAG